VHCVPMRAVIVVGQKTGVEGAGELRCRATHTSWMAVPSEGDGGRVGREWPGRTMSLELSRQWCGAKPKNYMSWFRGALQSTQSCCDIRDAIRGVPDEANRATPELSPFQKYVVRVFSLVSRRTSPRTKNPSPCPLQSNDTFVVLALAFHSAGALVNSANRKIDIW
jgi:hypothetical protein